MRITLIGLMICLYLRAILVARIVLTACGVILAIVVIGNLLMPGALVLYLIEAALLVARPDWGDADSRKMLSTGDTPFGPFVAGDVPAIHVYHWAYWAAWEFYALVLGAAVVAGWYVGRQGGKR